jgi:hypothetical protein
LSTILGARIYQDGRKLMDAGANKIKTFCLLGVIAVAVTVANKAALGETIGFDDFDTGGGTAFAAANRYVSQGIVFSRTIPVEDVQAVEPAFFPTFLAQGGTPPNAMALTPVSPVGFLSINASFVVPGTATPGITDLVSVRVFDTEVGTTLGTLEAFNSSGVLIATDTATTPPSEAGTLEVAVPDIASVQFSSDSDGADFDNVSFDTPVAAAVPAPLIGHGLRVVLAVAGLLFGVKLWERSKSRRSFGAAVPRAAA